MNEQNKSVEGVSTVPVYPDLHQMKHLHSNHSIETILVVFALLNGLNKLWISINKMRKQGRCTPNLLLQAVGAIAVILKAIDDELNRDDK
jgi:hypothetical protein